MKECGQLRSQGSFSSWNAALEAKRDLKPQCARSWPAIVSAIVNGNAPVCYLTIIPRARMASESIAHEAEGRMGY